MIGFEVIHNGNSLTAGVENGVLTVILTNRTMEDTSEISLNVAGLNLEAGNDTTWLQQNEIKEGDEIIIKVKKLEHLTTPLNIKNLDKESIQKNRVQAFHDLKSALEKEGLI